MKNDNNQKPKRSAARIAPMLYTGVGLTLCTVLALGPAIIKMPPGAGD